MQEFPEGWTGGSTTESAQRLDRAHRGLEQLMGVLEKGRALALSPVPVLAARHSMLPLIQLRRVADLAGQALGRAPLVGMLAGPLIEKCAEYLREDAVANARRTEEHLRSAATRMASYEQDLRSFVESRRMAPAAAAQPLTALHQFEDFARIAGRFGAAEQEMEEAEIAFDKLAVAVEAVRRSLVAMESERQHHAATLADLQWSLQHPGR